MRRTRAEPDEPFKIGAASLTAEHLKHEKEMDPHDKLTASQ
jgi:hypothetical protein